MAEVRLEEGMADLRSWVTRWGVDTLPSSERTWELCVLSLLCVFGLVVKFTARLCLSLSYPCR